MSFGKYQFLSWARRGIASQIIEKDQLGKADGNAVERARIPIKIKLNTGTESRKDFDLFGPGDITGINQNMVIRTEPLNAIADFEPNYLPYIEFYDEDFPFRYTPASPARSGGHEHLRPWLALIVLKENEFLETKRREPLTSIRVINKEVLPPHDQLHLWCHMHSNLPHEESDFEVFLDNLEEDVKSDPDGVYSRLLCPRKLESKTLYHAFLVPAYETGRLAGLGQPTTGIKAQADSLSSADNEFPVFYRWYFRTGQNFDFEYMVKLLKPRPMDQRVGVREMDCSRPGFVRADSDAEVRPTNPGILLQEGALMAPNARRSNLNINNQPFVDDIEKLLNLNLSQQENPNEDPYVSVPYYGMNHAMRRNNSLPGRKEIPVFEPSANTWHNEINRNPVYRVPAGFGKRVVQENQDRFMDHAWKQLGDILEANRRMRQARFASEAMERVFNQTLKKLPNESYVAMANVFASRVLDGDRTVRATLDDSLIDKASLDPAFRRMTRNNSTLIKGLKGRENSRDFSYDRMVKSINKPGGLSAEVKVQFKPIPQLNNLDTFQPPTSVNNIKVWSSLSNLQESFPSNLPQFTGGLPSVNKWSAPFSPSLFSVITTPPVIPTGSGIGGTTPVVTPGTGLTDRPNVLGRPRPLVLDPGRPGTIGTTPTLPTDTVTRPPVTVDTDRLTEVVLVNTSVANNKLATRQHTTAIKTAFRQVSQRYQFNNPPAVSPQANIAQVRKNLNQAILPHLAYQKMLDRRFVYPDKVFRPREAFLPVMAYPDIPEPAYQYLLDIDKEFLLPNLHLIENNTLSLLKTNQKFIESYLVGLNYEMGRELLWREFPTDMRGSYFRQFWDTRGFITPDTTPEDADRLKDIKPIHKWSLRDELGVHNARDKEKDQEQIVFVIRGDLLKKFPNTVIYAQKAHKDGDKKVIKTSFEPDEHKEEIRFPIYQAEIAPDIKLLGFDLTVNEVTGAKQTSSISSTDKAGWFFIIAEVPGEPRFGMDITAAINDTDNPNWNDLSWKHLPEDTEFIRGDKKPSLRVPAEVQKDTGKWGDSSADMATILLQRPVMVAVHASEMLEREIPDELFLSKPLTLKAYLAGINVNLLD